MNVKQGTIIITAAAVLAFGISVAAAGESKPDVYLNSTFNVEKIPEPIRKAGITDEYIKKEFESKVLLSGRKPLSQAEHQPSNPRQLYVRLTADEDSKGFIVCCSLIWRRTTETIPLKSGEQAIFWQKNSLASCDSSQIGQTAKKCLADCLDAFGKELKSEKSENARGQSMITGKIQRVNLEGGFFGIAGDDGQKYDPINLKDEFKKDGLAVKFTVKEKTGMVGIHMWGKIVEVVSMEAAEQKPAGPVTLQWLGHASFKISYGRQVIYIDPWKLKEAQKDATLVLVSHSHPDHYSPDDLKKIFKPDTKLIAPEDVIVKERKGTALKYAETFVISGVNGVKITGSSAYNPKKQFHPKSQNWLGFIIDIGGVRIYYAGDTDIIDEMKILKNINIDVALLPVGGNFTMNADEAAEAVKIIKPKQAIPYHFGDIVGKAADGRRFAQLADCDVLLINPGDIVSLKE